jgi:very-short-patch-repair endonuclease
MRELAGARPADHRPPESNSEDRLNDLLAAAGQPRLRRQVNAGDAERWLGRMDLADADLPLIFEVHSDLFHGSETDRRRDSEKRRAMEAGGWTFIEAWETEIWRTPDVVLDRIETARRQLRKAAA